MVIIELEGEEYNMPSGWDEVNIDMFEKIVHLSTGLSKYKSEIEFSIDMMALLTGAEKESLMKMTRKSFETLNGRLSWVNTEVKPSKKKIFTIDGEEFMPIENLNELSMGESISLEITIKDSNEANILTNILPILIRRVKLVERTNGKRKKVPASFNAEEYEELKELFKNNLTVPDVIELKAFF